MPSSSDASVSSHACACAGMRAIACMYVCARTVYTNTCMYVCACTAYTYMHVRMRVNWVDAYTGIHILTHAYTRMHARAHYPAHAHSTQALTKIDADGREMEERGEGCGKVRSRRNVRLAAHALDFRRRQTPRHQHSCHASAYISEHTDSGPSLARRRQHRSIAHARLGTRVLQRKRSRGGRDREEAGGGRGVAVAHAHRHTACRSTRKRWREEGGTASMEQVREGWAGGVLQEQTMASCLDQFLHQRLQHSACVQALILLQLLPGFHGGSN